MLLIPSIIPSILNVYNNNANGPNINNIINTKYVWNVQKKSMRFTESQLDPLQMTSSYQNSSSTEL